MLPGVWANVGNILGTRPPRDIFRWAFTFMSAAWLSLPRLGIAYSRKVAWLVLGAIAGVARPVEWMIVMATTTYKDGVIG